MTSSCWRYAVVPLAVICLGMTIEQPPPKASNLSQIRIPYRLLSGTTMLRHVYVISGRGKRIATFPRRRLGKTRHAEADQPCAYFDPSPHPAQDQFVVSRFCSPTNELITVSLNGPQPSVQVIYAVSRNTSLRLPQWSPDGDRLAFIEYTREGTVLTICDPGCRMKRQIELNVHRVDTLQWDADGTRLFFSNDFDDERLQLGEVALVSETVQWHALGAVWNWVQRPKTSPPDWPAVRRLYGSLEHPQRRIIWSPDRRYYFYFRGVESRFHETDSIMRYDVQRRKTARVRMIHFSLRFAVPPFTWLE